ncbi:MAG: hypothetical protein GY869_06775, partial [Planctomycetes bacterium]|nr:hypothetical protein [Planctomycetota bacterium]
MKRKILFYSVLFIVIAGFVEIGRGSEGIEPQQMVSAEIAGDELLISINGEKFTSYKFAATLKKPYFWPII